MLALVAMMRPGAIAGGIIGFVLYRLTGSPLALVPAAAVCLVIVGIEVLLATEALGPAIRTDRSAGRGALRVAQDVGRVR